MLMRKKRQRAGAVLVEAAMIYPVLFVVVFAIIMLGISVARYQQVAHAAREGARWAAVHGQKYAEEQNRPAATPQDVYDNAIAPQAGGMRPPDLSYAVTWNRDNRQTHTYLVTDPATGKTRMVTRANTVSVTVTYQWNTGLFGVIRVSSTTVMLMSY